MNLRLKEILWELTLKCNKSCSYCGSKSLLNKEELQDSRKIDIAKQIVFYPPERITLTGGEPALDSSLNDVLDIFNKTNIPVSVVTNGTALSLPQSTLNKINTIGLSVNTEEDLLIKIPPSLNHKITLITNFGSHNIFLYKTLFSFFKANNFPIWQIQLTMGEPYQLPKDGIKYLLDEIFDHDLFFTYPAIIPKNDQKIVLSDNLQSLHDCTAGIESMSIANNGDVIRCLSQRTWDTNIISEGNLLQTSLKEIWENRFKSSRFSSCKCCRDFFKYPEITCIKKPNVKLLLEETDYPPTVTYYGVFTNPPVLDDPSAPHLYPLVTAYAVITKDSIIYNSTDNITYTYND
jgi:sulfatase maturation enzyme AslB (radical SAM superfamily)